MLNNEIMSRDSFIYDKLTSSKKNNMIFVLTIIDAINKSLLDGVTLDRLIKLNKINNLNGMVEINSLIYECVDKLVMLISKEGWYSVMYDKYDTINDEFNKYAKKVKKVFSYVKIRQDTKLSNPRYNISVKNVSGGELSTQQLNMLYCNFDDKIDENNKLISDKQNHEYYYFGPYDKVFKNDVNNVDMSNDVSKHLIDRLDNEDVCIIGYGQSGAGKTSTLIYFDADGKTPQNGVLFEMFKQEKFRNKFENNITLDMFNIYLHHNIKVTEAKLFNNENYYVKSHVVENKDFIYDIGKNNWIDKDVTSQIPLPSYIIKTFNDPTKRQIEPTPNNKQSSRSHMIVILKLKIKGTNTIRNIIICDLAGVENVFNCDSKDELINFYKRYKDAQKNIVHDRRSCDEIDDLRKKEPEQINEFVNNLGEGIFNQTLTKQYNNDMETIKKINEIDIQSGGIGLDDIEQCTNQVDDKCGNFNLLEHSNVDVSDAIKKLDDIKKNIHNIRFDIDEITLLLNKGSAFYSRFGSMNIFSGDVIKRYIYDYKNDRNEDINERRIRILDENTVPEANRTEILKKINWNYGYTNESTRYPDAKYPYLMVKHIIEMFNAIINDFNVIEEGKNIFEQNKNMLTTRYGIKFDNDIITYLKTKLVAYTKLIYKDENNRKYMSFHDDPNPMLKPSDDGYIELKKNVIPKFGSFIGKLTIFNDLLIFYKDRVLGEFIKIKQSEIHSISCANITFNKLKYNCQLRKIEGMMINKSLSDLRNDIRKLILSLVKINKDENKYFLPLFFDKEIMPYCRNININENAYERFYDNKQEKDGIYGIIMDILNKKEISTNNLIFVIFTVINLTGQEQNKDTNNPPNPPYININNIYYYNNIKYNREKLINESNKFMDKILKYAFYRSYFLSLYEVTTVDDIKQSFANEISRISSSDDDLRKKINDNIKMVQINNAATLIGSLESTDMLQNITYDKIPCSYSDELSKEIDNLKKIGMRDTYGDDTIDKLNDELLKITVPQVQKLMTGGSKHKLQFNAEEMKQSYIMEKKKYLSRKNKK
jgi:predicted CopG family antitoxin